MCIQYHTSPYSHPFICMHNMRYYPYILQSIDSYLCLKDSLSICIKVHKIYVMWNAENHMTTWTFRKKCFLLQGCGMSYSLIWNEIYDLHVKKLHLFWLHECNINSDNAIHIKLFDVNDHTIRQRISQKSNAKQRISDCYLYIIQQ